MLLPQPPYSALSCCCFHPYCTHSAKRQLRIQSGLFLLLCLLLMPSLQTMGLILQSPGSQSSEFLKRTAKKPCLTVHIRFPSSLSVNAAISASVVLSSRLASHLQVFSLVLFGTEWFALFPILRKQILVCFASISAT